MLRITVFTFLTLLSHTLSPSSLHPLVSHEKFTIYLDTNGHMHQVLFPEDVDAQGCPVELTVARNCYKTSSELVQEAVTFYNKYTYGEWPFTETKIQLEDLEGHFLQFKQMPLTQSKTSDKERLAKRWMECRKINCVLHQLVLDLEATKEGQEPSLVLAAIQAVFQASKDAISTKETNTASPTIRRSDRSRKPKRPFDV